MFKSMLALAVALSAATYSWADDDDDLKPRPDDGRPEHTLRLSQLMKYKILIQDDQPAGQVVDVILSNGGCVDYIVASYEDQYYTIPYQAAAVRYDDSLVFVDIAPATFREVQFFSNDNWPDFYVPTYRQQVFSTFGLRADQVNRNGRSTFRQNLDNDDADDAARRERRQENREDRQQRRDDRRDIREERRENRRERRDDARDNPKRPKPSVKVDLNPGSEPKPTPDPPRAEPKNPAPKATPPATPKTPAAPKSPAPKQPAEPQ